MNSPSKFLYDNSAPPILPSIYSLRFEDKLVLVIEVSQGMTKPYFVKSDGLTNGTYIRLGAMTVKATAEIINELQQ
jgi:ATP-dependent DNA helicase RecG